MTVRLQTLFGKDAYHSGIHGLDAVFVNWQELDFCMPLE